MVLLLLLPLFLAVLIVAFIYFMTRVDADLTLFYYDRQDKILAGTHTEPPHLMQHVDVVSALRLLVQQNSLLRNKVVWITGSSSGLGEYLAYELARNGCKLILSGTSQERLEKVKQKCKEIGAPDEDVFVLPFNMTQFDLHEECVKRVIAKFGKLDVLVNNAGRSQRANFQDIDVAVDKELFEVNVFAVLNLTRKVLPHFLENNGGHFVVTSSCVGKMGAASSASYTGSKHAIHGYFETLRTEMSRKNIDVTILCPGPVFSRFLENAFTGTPGEKFGKPTQSSDKRMPTDRCGRLMAVAIAHKLDEAWIAIQPCLLFYYMAQYTPTFFRRIVIGKLYTPERAEKIREGRW